MDEAEVGKNVQELAVGLARCAGETGGALTSCSLQVSVRLNVGLVAVLDVIAAKSGRSRTGLAGELLAAAVKDLGEITEDVLSISQDDVRARGSELLASKGGAD